jgi:hypothetical protein
MTLKILIVAAALGTVAVLGGCSGKDSPGSGGGGATGTASARAGQPPGGAKSSKPTCDLAPPAMVNAALGTNVGAPAAQNLGTIAVCRYSPSSGTGAVVVRVQTDMSAATFAQSRQVSDANGLPTSDLPGFEDQAYTSTLTAGSHTVNTVVALKGTVQVLISSPASFDAEKALATQIFTELG